MRGYIMAAMMLAAAAAGCRSKTQQTTDREAQRTTTVQSADTAAVLRPLEFDDLVYDFGRINEADGVVSHRFAFVNRTGVPVSIVRVLSSCSCISADFDRKAVQPDQRGQIGINYNPAYRDGFFSEGLDVIFSDGERERHTKIWINGNVAPCKHPIEDDHPYHLGGGLHANLQLFLAGGMQAGAHKEIIFRYANALDRKMDVRFEVDGATASSLEMPRTLELKPDERGVMRIGYTMPEGRLGLQRLTIRPVVNGRTIQPLEFTAIGLPRPAAEGQARPSAVCQTRNIVLPDSEGPHKFEIVLRNEGTAPLHILAVDLPEGMDSGLTQGVTIGAGDERRFESWASASAAGSENRIYVVTDDPSTPYFIIRIAAQSQK